MKSSNKRIIWRVVGIIFVLLFMVSAVLLYFNIYGCEGDVASIKNPSPDTTSVNTLPGTFDSTTDETTEPEPEVPLQTGELPSQVLESNTVDFEGLAGINKDIYAWIKVPGTPIDYPILESEDSDLYYERRNYEGNYSISGCIFTQYYNTKGFKDRNTIVYGHYMMDGTFFGSLHNYKDPDFFEKNRYIYVTLPNRVLVYEIFAAYEFDNRHILAAFDFNNDDEYADYLNMCLNPPTMVRTIREGTELTTDDKLITLSTCTSYTDTSKRYLVQGVLIADVEA